MPKINDITKIYESPTIFRELKFKLSNYNTEKRTKNTLNVYPDRYATKARFIGRHNRLMGGIMLKQTKSTIESCKQALNTEKKIQNNMKMILKHQVEVHTK